jgi:hypothetical protein
VALVFRESGNVGGWNKDSQVEEQTEAEQKLKFALPQKTQLQWVSELLAEGEPSLDE